MDRIKIKPYDQALWEWFLSKAAIRTVHGVDRKLNETFRRHLAQCGIDVDYSDAPTVGTIAEFADTFSDCDETPGVVSDHWRCLCHKWSDDHHYTLAIEGEIELNRVIYEVIQFGLGNFLLESVTAPEED